MLTIKDVTIKDGNRVDYRRKLVELFLDEAPGTGKRELTTTYRYNVEKLKDDVVVFLKRPARLNKGFDFEIHVENFFFNTTRRNTMPSHNDILTDITKKIGEQPGGAIILFEMITEVYECNMPSKERIAEHTFNTGANTELLLKVIKWLFIEQDITYWNWSGRAMFLERIREVYEENNCPIY